MSMADMLTKAQRSELMSKVRGKWTTYEKNIHNHLKGNKIKHRMHPRIGGNPDILLPEKNTVIFVDGCFWHGCPTCYTAPKSNMKYWRQKIIRNKKNDVACSRMLNKMGFRVVRLRECALKKDFRRQMSKLIQ